MAEYLNAVCKVCGKKYHHCEMCEQIGSWRDKNDIIFISHGDCIEDAQYVADLIKDRFGYESFLINHVGPTIGAHTGPGVVALFYMGDYR